MSHLNTILHAIPLNACLLVHERCLYTNVLSLTQQNAADQHSTRGVTLHSPVAICYSVVCNKPTVRYMQRSDHTEHYNVLSHTQKTRHFRGWIPAGARDFCPFQWVQAGSGAQPAPCLMGTSPSFRNSSGRSVKLTTHIHLVPALRMSGTTPLPPPPACLQGLDWEKFPFTDITLRCALCPSYSDKLVPCFLSLSYGQVDGLGCAIPGRPVEKQANSSTLLRQISHPLSKIKTSEFGLAGPRHVILHFETMKLGMRRCVVGRVLTDVSP
jgi:hypothetical protein